MFKEQKRNNSKFEHSFLHQEMIGKIKYICVYCNEFDIENHALRGWCKIACSRVSMDGKVIILGHNDKS